MGEIRIEVLLTNVIDEGIARRGTIDASEVRKMPVNALVDTGAIRCVVPVHVVDQLGLATVDRAVAEYADGRQETVDVTEPIVFEIMGRRTRDEALVLGDEVLIGQTVLEKLDLVADCANQRLLPNPDHPDQPVSKVKFNRSRHDKNDAALQSRAGWEIQGGNR